MKAHDYIIFFLLIGVFSGFFSEMALLHAFFHTMNGLLLFASGYCFRTLRRYCFFKKRLSIHQAGSFECLFQGFTLVYPQLPYPYVERNFIKREAGSIPHKALSSWFSIRNSSAIVLPFVLLASIFFAMEWITCSVVCLSFAGLFFYRSQHPVACLMGVCALLSEMFFFTQMMPPSVPLELQCLFFSFTIVIYELSPIPLSFGLLELVFASIVLAFGFPKSLLVAPIAYRFFRAIPILLGMLFYMPRYKLSFMDIFHTDLPSLLRKQWEKKDTHTAEKELSIVIPAYNEEKRLPLFLPSVLEEAEKLFNTEVIVVDDGSTDRTREYVESLIATYPFLSIEGDGKNRGKGFAVQRGVQCSQGRYILFADADGATPIEEIRKLLEAAREGHDIVIGIRDKSRKELQKSILREIMSCSFYRLTNLLVVPGILDTQCGFKLFRYEAAKKLFSMPKEKGFAFDVEVLFLAQKYGMTIAQVPVTWTQIEGSKINPISDALKMFIALFRIRHRWVGFSS